MAFTEFSTIIPTPKEVNQRGIAYCRNVLGDKDPITKAFNRLSQPEKGCVIALAGTESGDLKTSFSSSLTERNQKPTKVTAMETTPLNTHSPLICRSTFHPANLLVG
ncbi:hypothetical protein [Avibacterium paragallinarum]|uniref:hypothetical protein n=1 Tax=Avibacterium paragallinarum TaxID=728 RepID=UPI00227E25EE|nr:hypothetical protein [Avibacterium paragallinarum]WAL56748.1 hypothetical protein OY678_12670 [Avibacterium paragallinarum]